MNSSRKVQISTLGKVLLACFSLASGQDLYAASEVRLTSPADFQVFQRATAERAWEESMGWDCVFAARVAGLAD